jgi:GNAT superfamily N-acetyltransferase
MTGPSFRVMRTDLARILPLRALYLQEMNCQIRYNACHERGWTDSYLLTVDGVEVGYGSIKGQELAGRDTAFEIYVLPPFRRHARALFDALLTTTGAICIECQTNDRQLTPLLLEFADGVTAGVVLFEAGATTDHVLPGAIVRARREDDRVFGHEVEPVGDYVLDLHGEVVATGGFLLHYNPPFADIFMEVADAHRKRGVATFLVQEVIRLCYLAGRVPAARCNVANLASRATLAKAGLRPCGFMLKGDVKRDR